MYHTVFNSLLKLELKFSEVNQINKLEATCPMTFEEENARYVYHKVRDIIIKLSVKDKEEIILFCFELSGDEYGKGVKRSGPV